MPVPGLLILSILPACTSWSVPVDPDGDGWAEEQGDCGPGDAQIHPEAIESCDGKDNDCDDRVDEGTTLRYYRDIDADGVGTAVTVEACDRPAGYAAATGDCNDLDSSIYPGALELCDSEDNDCDEVIDPPGSEGAAWFIDADEDGYGSAGETPPRCETSAGYVDNEEDCNDADPSIHPDRQEVCNEIDDDCDSVVDERSDGSPLACDGCDYIQAVAGGDRYSLALCSDGTVWGWGYNELGQLGNGSTIDSSTPVQAVGLPPITAITAGSVHSMAIDADGQLWTWGHNYYGQLGDGTNYTGSLPEPVEGLPAILQVSGGGDQTLARAADRLWVWGRNDYYHLGLGDDLNRSTPTASSLGSLAAVAGGYYHSLAIDPQDRLWTWGFNGYGQVGNGSYDSFVTSPVMLATPREVVAVSGGDEFSLALDSAGQVWGWGRNQYGQVGDGTTYDQYTPEKVAGLAGITAIAAGAGHAVVVDAEGVVWAWGKNDLCQLGNQGLTVSTEPVQVPGLPPISALSAGASHTLALDGDGRIWAWGSNAYHQLADDTLAYVCTPVQISILP